MHVRALLLSLMAFCGVFGCTREAPDPVPEVSQARFAAAHSLMFGRAAREGFSQTCLPTPNLEIFTVRGMSYGLMYCTAEHFNKVRGDRDAALAALKDRIRTALDATDEQGLGDMWLCAALNYAIDLNAVELLPLLLELETHTRKIDPELWSANMSFITIATLLRAEEYPPLMETELGQSGRRPSMHDNRAGYPIRPDWHPRILGWAKDYIAKNPRPDGRKNMLPETFDR